MDNKRAVSASIMCADFLDLHNTVTTLNNGGCEYLHFDVMDGSFSNDYLLGNKLIADVNRVSKMRQDFHLMIRNPESYISELVVGENDIITVHYELCENLGKVINILKEKKCKIGVALDIATPTHHLMPHYKDIQVVLVMLTQTGKMGNTFHELALDKIKEIRAESAKQGVNVLIEADGSVNEVTIPRLKEIGVDIFVGGSSGLFLKDKSLSESLTHFKHLVATQ